MPNNISYTNITSIILKEINRFRSDPKELIPILEARRGKYDQQGNYFPMPGLNFSVKTKEGTKGIDNLIDFLDKQRESADLEWNYELHQAADKRCHFLSSTEEKNMLNRVANLQVSELVSEFTTWKGNLVELTFYGFIEPRQFICELLLEDGRSQKDNRVEFFNRVSAFIGIGINVHEQYRFVIVMIMAMQVANHEPFRSYKTIERQSQQAELMKSQHSMKSLKSMKSMNSLDKSGRGSVPRLQFPDQPLQGAALPSIEEQQNDLFDRQPKIECNLDNCSLY